MSTIVEHIGDIGAGFADPVFGAQAAFRGALDSMAAPGSIVDLGAIPETPSPLDPATVALCLALVDQDTPIWLGEGAARQAVYDYLRFHCGCPVVKSTRAARFAIALANEVVPSLDTMNLGTDQQPDLSTTMILQVPTLDDGNGVRLTGPGIENEARFSIGGVPPHFWRERKMQESLFPRGVDVFFTCGRRLAALPRSTVIEV